MPRILLVDDEPKLRGAIRQMLEPLGIDIEEASDGQDAVRKFRAHPAELVICDMFMPEKDGLEVIRVLAEQYPGAKVLAMSGGAFDGALDVLPDARLFGAAAVIYKPFAAAMLQKLVGEMLVPLSE